MKKNTLYIFTALLIAALFQGCKNGTKVNNDINSDTRSKIAELNKKLFNGIITNNAGAVRALLSPELIKKTDAELNMVIDRCSKRYPAKDFGVLDEYLSTDLKKNANDTLKSAHGNDSDYTIGFQVSSEEMYTSVLITKDLPINGAILAVYGKYGDDWKINILQIGDYSIFNKNAVDYYKEALALYGKGNLVDATDMIIIASQLVSPAGQYFSYKKESDMHILFSKVVDEANATFKLPVIMSQVKTAPQIFQMSPQVVEETGYQGVFPLIKYKSNIKLSDTVALKAENQALQQSIGTMFKGIDDNNNYILYEAYNGTPDGKTPTKHYGFVQKLK